MSKVIEHTTVVIQLKPLQQKFIDGRIRIRSNFEDLIRIQIQ
jgi:hypothetical protein